MAGEIKYLLYNIKFQIAAAMEYRFNFLLLNISMFLNDVFLIIFWYTILYAFYFKLIINLLLFSYYNSNFFSIINIFSYKVATYSILCFFIVIFFLDILNILDLIY